ncbi:hypothetical protein P154DRAFT_569335 [Amniculicola lignicola CBS 123094]|uniref:Uncharacterized protein n=1 Tax=Amniculicola lignicola CBS 123094 TaxID=1392246 RepID=A0A6A5X3H1_9PLEO|nr:hypothetical protein P154DRAFT_569335 [Amniculicola lignicola CBS 123094]
MTSFSRQNQKYALERIGRTDREEWKKENTHPSGLFITRDVQFRLKWTKDPETKTLGSLETDEKRSFCDSCDSLNLKGVLEIAKSSLSASGPVGILTKLLHHSMELLSHYRHLRIDTHQQIKNRRMLMKLETTYYHIGTTNEIYQRRPFCSLCRVVYATLECRMKDIHVLRSGTPLYFRVEADSWSMFLALSLERGINTGSQSNGSMRIRSENGQITKTERSNWLTKDLPYCSFFRELYRMEPSSWKPEAKI